MENTPLLQESNLQTDDQDNTRPDPIPPDWIWVPTPAAPKPNRAEYPWCAYKLPLSHKEIWRRVEQSHYRR
jgi:hypothetical protein